VLQAPRQYLLIAEADQLEAARADLQNAWADQVEPAAAFVPFSPAPVHRQVREAWLTNTQVNFCAKAYPTVPFEHADSAALSVLAGFLRNGYLHRVIREQGGAYGGGASHDSENAVFRFYSYRDPRLEGTLEDFDRAVNWTKSTNGDWSRKRSSGSSAASTSRALPPGRPKTRSTTASTGGHRSTAGTFGSVSCRFRSTISGGSARDTLRPRRQV
jgi:Zn-dependent M16 (insulinase) family peptidase